MPPVYCILRVYWRVLRVLRVYSRILRVLRVDSGALRVLRVYLGSIESVLYCECWEYCSTGGRNTSRAGTPYIQASSTNDRNTGGTGSMSNAKPRVQAVSKILNNRNTWKYPRVWTVRDIESPKFWEHLRLYLEKRFLQYGQYEWRPKYCQYPGSIRSTEPLKVRRVFAVSAMSNLNIRQRQARILAVRKALERWNTASTREYLQYFPPILPVLGVPPVFPHENALRRTRYQVLYSTPHNWEHLLWKVKSRNLVYNLDAQQSTHHYSSSSQQAVLLVLWHTIFSDGAFIASKRLDTTKNLYRL